jgi:general secretion pathway protein G
MNRKAFTLIELLIVVTILAILAGAAIPYVQLYIEDSRISKAKTDLDELKNALALYETKRGENYTKTDGSDLVNRGFLTKLTIDPWGAPYVVGNGDVYSRGPDGVPNNEDDLRVRYQPPLSVVSAQWWDSNNDSLINAGDRLLLRFARPLKTPQGGMTPGAWLTFTPAGPTLTVANIACLDSSGKSGYYEFSSVTNFSPGTSKITINAGTPLQDADSTECFNDSIKVTAR